MTELFLPRERFVDPEMVALSPQIQTRYHYLSFYKPLRRQKKCCHATGGDSRCFSQLWGAKEMLLLIPSPRGNLFQMAVTFFNNWGVESGETVSERERERESVNLKLPSIYLFFLTNGRKRNSRLMLMAGTVWESKRRQMCSCHMMKQTLGRNCHIAAQKKLHHVIESVGWFRLGLQCGYTRNRL